ncbi:MAG: hypothetical protein HY017_00410 [Betaproteobacteria bacterium]|nr:hypothetical protein [Betaproteobacteria bacterium]
MLKVRRVIFLVPVVLHLAACAPIVTMLGLGSPAVQVASQLDQASLVAGGVIYVRSGKTISDHVLSNVTGDNCTITNVVSGAPICVAEGVEGSGALITSSDNASPEQNF